MEHCSGSNCAKGYQDIREVIMTERIRTLIHSALVGATAIAILHCAAGTAQAAGYDVGSLHLAQPWSRETPKGASAGAAYLTVTNNGAAPDRLSCAGSEAAAQCQIHTMSMENGVMKMRPVEGGLEIKPGETVTLKPGTNHLMLMNLKHPLEAGKAVEATLQFEKAGTVKVEFPILAMGAAAPGAAAGGGGSMMMEGHDHMMQPGQH
jgi:copper(I)-binding protein